MKYILIVCLVIAAGCKTRHQNTNFEYNISENPWIDAFKDKAFVSCLKESYKNDSIFKMIEEVDLYNPYDGYYTINEFVAKADNIGRVVAKNIPKTNYRDYGKSNYYMATCLHYYASKELDSIAKAEYKKYIKIVED